MFTVFQNLLSSLWLKQVVDTVIYSNFCFGILLISFQTDNFLDVLKKQEYVL
jgi:hypothetical protein